MFPLGSLAASIRLEGLSNFERDTSRAESSFRRIGEVGASVMRGAKQAVDLTAGAVGAITIAGGAYLANVTRTGMAYNTLQQTARAALVTLTGSAEAANDQMAKLDDFARNSPFSKATFIQAQQQLIGFGVEAQKVIPILQSVQDAVAATGGSNESISEIVRILAQIRSAGKITGEDLMQLGDRGIDAASLIGNAFGQTAAEVRKSITDGKIDSLAAFDALVSQMGSKYEGAAAGVKNTWIGTVDRIKAANREIGASIAEPFISQNGGGMAIMWGNQVADVMRAVLGHVTPIVSVLNTRMLPAWAALTTGLDRLRVNIKAWDSSRFETFMNHAEAYAPALAAVGGALLGITTGLASGIPIIGPYAAALGPIPLVLAAIAATSPDVRAGLAAILESFAPLVPVAADLARTIAGTLNVALPILGSGLQIVAAVLEPVVELIAQVPAPMLATAAAAVGFAVAARNLGPSLQTMFDGLRRIGEQVAVQSALAAMEGNTSTLAGGFGVAGKAATGFGNALKAAFVTNPVGLVIMGVTVAATALVAVLTAQGEAAAAASDRLAGYREVLDETSGALTKNTRAHIDSNLQEQEARKYADELGISYNDLIDAILGNADALTRVNGLIEENGAAYSATTNVRNGYTDAGNNLIRILREEGEALKGAADETRRDAQEKRDAAAAMSEFARSNQRMNEALEIARDITKSAEERLRGLKQALDELNGGAKSAAEAQKELNDQTRNLQEVFNVTDEAGNRLIGSLVNGAGEIDTTTAAGSRLFEQVGRLNDQMNTAILLEDEAAKKRGESGVSMEKAREAAAPYIDTLRRLGAEAGLNDEQINGMIQTMFDVPEVTAYALTDNGTVDAEKLRVMDLAFQILATPNKDFDIQSKDIPGVMEALRGLGVKIETLPDGTVKVTKDGQSFSWLEGELNNLARTRTATIKANIDRALRTDGSAGGMQSGGLISGGVQSFDRGGFPSGIYSTRGTNQAAIHKFAENWLPWEAYISPAPAYRARNKALTKEVAARLGGVAYFGNEAPGGQVPRVRSFDQGGVIQGAYVPAPSQAGAERSVEASEQLPGFLVTGNQFIGFDEERLIDELEARRFQALAVAGLLKE